MPVWKIPAPFRYYTDKQPTVTVRGQTVAAALDDLIQQHPSLQPKLYKKSGELYAFVNLFVGENKIKNLQGLENPINEDDKLKLVPSIAGG